MRFVLLVTFLLATAHTAAIKECSICPALIHQTKVAMSHEQVQKLDGCPSRRFTCKTLPGEKGDKVKIYVNDETLGWRASPHSVDLSCQGGRWHLNSTRVDKLLCTTVEL